MTLETGITPLITFIADPEPLLIIFPTGATVVAFERVMTPELVEFKVKLPVPDIAPLKVKPPVFEVPIVAAEPIVIGVTSVTAVVVELISAPAVPV